MLTEIPNGLDEIIDTYGSLDDPQFETEHIVLINCPIRYVSRARK